MDLNGPIFIAMSLSWRAMDDYEAIPLSPSIIINKYEPLLDTINLS